MRFGASARGGAVEESVEHLQQRGPQASMDHHYDDVLLQHSYSVLQAFL
jgi:hypothetical protein